MQSAVITSNTIHRIFFTMSLLSLGQEIAVAIVHIQPVRVLKRLKRKVIVWFVPQCEIKIVGYLIVIKESEDHEIGCRLYPVGIEVRYGGVYFSSLKRHEFIALPIARHNVESIFGGERSIHIDTITILISLTRVGEV